MPPRKTAKTLTRSTYAALLLFAVLAGVVGLSYREYIAMQLRYSSGAVPVVEPRPTAPEGATFKTKVEPNTLWIDSLGIKTPVIPVAEKTEKAYQEALKHGIGHFPGTATAGQPGNMYVFGHSSDFSWSDGDYKTVFALLPKIAVGDIIVVSDAEGTPYEYRVTGTAVISPKDLSVLDQHNYQKRMLTVQTSYPLGTALKRFIAIAELVE
jgi:LPXTG-site transpeptidase (sortase) family protein